MLVKLATGFLISVVKCWWNWHQVASFKNAPSHKSWNFLKNSIRIRNNIFWTDRRRGFQALFRKYFFAGNSGCLLTSPEVVKAFNTRMLFKLDKNPTSFICKLECDKNCCTKFLKKKSTLLLPVLTFYTI
jgi:hypothetical protein